MDPNTGQGAETFYVHQTPIFSVGSFNDKIPVISRHMLMTQDESLFKRLDQALNTNFGAPGIVRWPLSRGA